MLLSNGAYISFFTSNIVCMEDTEMTIIDLLIASVMFCLIIIQTIADDNSINIKQKNMN